MTIGPPVVGTPDVNSKWRVDIDTDPNHGGSWAQLRGIKSLDPVLDSSVKDASDYDTGGWGSDAVTSRKWGLTGTVLRKRYAGSYDAAQQRLSGIAESANFNELVHVRFYERETGGKAYEGYALVQWKDKAGAQDDLSEADFTLLGQGERFAITNPFGTTEAPTVAALAPSTGPAAGGTLVKVSGSGFTGVTGAASVKFGTTNASSYTVDSDNVLWAVSPAGTAGAVEVKVTNSTGTSTAGAQFTYA